MVPKKTIARCGSTTWIEAITLSAANTAKIAMTGLGTALSRNRPVASATARTTKNTPSEGDGSTTWTPRSSAPSATAAW